MVIFMDLFSHSVNKQELRTSKQQLILNIEMVIFSQRAISDRYCNGENPDSRLKNFVK